MRQKMAIFKEGNSVSKCFSGAFILYSIRNEQLGAMRQKMAIFKERNSVCRVHIFLMIMMMMISCWCCDDDASLSSISFLKSLIAQQPFCKMILIKLFIFWDRRINVISPKHIYLGELMSTVRGVHVGGWAGVGACSAEGGRRPGRTRRRAALGRLLELW